MIGQGDLAEYYKLNTMLVYYNHFSLSELESMLPFEREIYVNEIGTLIDKENRKQKEQQ